MREEKWEFWTARAHVVRMGAKTLIELRGVVTAQVYEALHLRMGIGPGLGTHTLILGWPALLATTSISAVEAAVRGTPSALFCAGRPMTICVPEARLQWARSHCDFMAQRGMYRLAVPLQDQVPHRERLAA